jgi:hypothetical protein
MFTPGHNVFVTCGEVIIGTDEVHWLKKEDIILNWERLSVQSYQLYYRVESPEVLIGQYEIC